MKREILFKAKRKYNNEWVYGDLIQLLGEQGKDRKFIIDNRFGACIDNKGNFINTESPFVIEVIPETVSQYTGLEDKNDKKIFDGDIMKNKLCGIGIVKYSKYAEFILDFIADCTCTSFNPATLRNYEVIGNIFDEEVK